MGGLRPLRRPDALAMIKRRAKAVGLTQRAGSVSNNLMRKDIAAELCKQYTNRKPALRRVRDRLRSILKEVVRTIEDKDLVRARVHRIRIKSLSSLQRKAERQDWGVDEALRDCNDLIGGRVVCNNVEDVYRFAELLKERFSTWAFPYKKITSSNLKKTDIGRLHVNFMMGNIGGRGFPSPVPCEVQIRSRLQDAWARLAHDDIYKRTDLPEDLRARATDLSGVLAAADTIASNIRSRVMRETTPSTHHPDLGCISEESLEYSFRHTFGRSLRYYVVRQALDLCERYQITTLEELPKLLRAEPAFRSRVEDTYRSILGGNIVAEDFFLVALYATAKGEAAAIQLVERNARQELEQLVIREENREMPNTVNDLIAILEDPYDEPNIEGLAQTLGAIHRCPTCSAEIVKPFSFAEAAVQHYDVPEPDDARALERIQSAIRSSGTEIGGFDEGELCGYHAEQAAKND